jgi:glycosyltransferase involved in cell wall biosynthesis
MITVLSVFGINPKRIGGNEAFARELSRQLAARGCRSVLVFSRAPSIEVSQFLSVHNVTVEVVQDLHRAGVHQCLKLIVLLRRHRPTVVHLHYVGFVGPYPWLARVFARARVYFTDHTSHVEGHTGQVRPLWKRAIAAAAAHPVDRYIAVSGFGEGVAHRARLVRASKVSVIYNGVDLVRSSGSAGEADRFRIAHRIPLNHVVVVQMGSLTEDKGVVDLLNAAAIVVAEKPDVHFVLAGEGPERAAFERFAIGLGLREYVTWTGLIHDPFAEGLYQAADIVCQVSRWQEAFGWVIAEAMSCGRPVVATRVGGIPELIVDGTTGTLVARRDPDAIAAAVLRLASNPDLRSKFGNAGLERSRRLFDLRPIVAKVLELYRLSD